MCVCKVSLSVTLCWLVLLLFEKFAGVNLYNEIFNKHIQTVCISSFESHFAFPTVSALVHSVHIHWKKRKFNVNKKGKFKFLEHVLRREYLSLKSQGFGFFWLKSVPLVSPHLLPGVHLLIFPISSHSRERYWVSFTIMMMTPPPVSMQDGHSSEWKTTAWS